MRVRRPALLCVASLTVTLLAAGQSQGASETNQPQSQPPPSPGSSQPIVEARLTASGALSVSEGANGARVRMTVDEASSTSLKMYDGKLSDGTPVTAVVYHEMQPDPDTWEQFWDSVDEEDDGPTEDIYDSRTDGTVADAHEVVEEYDAEPFDASEMYATIAEVSTPQSVSFVLSDEYRQHLAGQEHEEKNDPVVEVYRGDGTYAGDLDEENFFYEEDPQEGPNGYSYEVYGIPEDENEETVTTSFHLQATGFETLRFNPPNRYTSLDVRYRTFIPDARVSAPKQACGGWGLGSNWYKGDNRSYSASAWTYRTSARIKIRFGTQKISLDKAVSPTIRYESQHSNKVVETKTASANGMRFAGGAGKPRADRNSAYFHLLHDVGHPTCIGGSIFYQFSGYVYATGSYSLSGERRKMPAHEAYLTANNGKWHTITQRPQVSKWCLPFPCGRDPWKTSGTARNL